MVKINVKINVFVSIWTEVSANIYSRKQMRVYFSVSGHSIGHAATIRDNNLYYIHVP